MKSMTEMRDNAMETMGDVAETSKKAAYAVVGAPVVAGRKLKDYTGKFTETAQKQLETWIAEGEKLTSDLLDRKTLTELKDKVDLDQLQTRVEKLRDQLEDVLSNWRETFIPGADKAEDKAPAPKPAAKKAPAKATAKKPAAKSTTKKAPAKKAPAKKATSSK